MTLSANCEVNQKSLIVNHHSKINDIKINPMSKCSLSSFTFSIFPHSKIILGKVKESEDCLKESEAFLQESEDHLKAT